ncbi:MAG: HD-GYP domain-containing protein [Desulfitobacteriaceae bacterium]
MQTYCIPVEHVNDGDILAKDVKNTRGIILVPKDCTINSYLKNKLIEMGIQNVWVYSRKRERKFTDNDYLGLVFSFKEVFRELSAGKEIDYAKINELSEVLLSDTLEDSEVIRLLSQIRCTDEYTYSHSLNVAFYSMFIAKWLNLPAKHLKEVTQAGLLHDIGKAFVPLDILNKNGKLTAEEFDVIKKHTILGFQLINGHSKFSEEVKKGALLHHERTNGSGYPYGLNGEMINLCPKIVAVADVYDAMTQNRVYKNGVTPFEVFEMFQVDGVEIFDYEIVNVLLKNISAHLVGLNVLLKNGKQYEIVHICPQDITHPILFDGSEIITTSTSNTKIKKVF